MTTRLTDADILKISHRSKSYSQDEADIVLQLIAEWKEMRYQVGKMRSYCQKVFDFIEKQLPSNMVPDGIAIDLEQALTSGEKEEKR